VGAEMMFSGREFQISAAATGKARLPTVESLPRYVCGVVVRLAIERLWVQISPSPYVVFFSYRAACGQSRRRPSRYSASKIASLGSRRNWRAT